MGQKGSTSSGASSAKQASATSKSPRGRKKNLAVNDTAQTHNFQSRPVENLILVWLDSKTDESNEDTRHLIIQFRRIINSIKTFIDSKQCVDYLTKVEDEKIFFLVSESVRQEFIFRVSEIPQVDSIYMFCDDKSQHQQLTQQCIKVKGVFTQIEPLCDALRVDVRQSECDLIPISIISSLSMTHLNEVDPSLMYSQLLKEILLERKQNDEGKKQLVDFCRLHYVDNDQELRVINEFAQNYPQPSSIGWYTRECFISRMLNKALRTQDIQVIIKMDFIIVDLHRQLQQLQTNNRQPLIVYRGQRMSLPEFEKIKKSQSGLLSFNNFLSTTTNRTVSLDFARRAPRNSDLMGILFRFNIDPSISTTPFASLDNISCKQNEILFSIHTVFRIGEIKQIEDRLFEVNLTSIRDDDEQISLLTQHMQQVTADAKGLYRLAKLMIHIRQFDKAKQIYMTLLETTPDDDWKQLVFLHTQLGVLSYNKNDLTDALSHWQQSLDINLMFLSSDDPQLPPSYANLGLVLKQQGETESALKNYKCALSIELRAPHPDYLNIATYHNNIGLVLKDQGKYGPALKSFERALEIFLVHFTLDHPSLATTYSNIGSVHYLMGNNAVALSYYEKTLKIEEKSLSPDHPSLARTHNNMAYVLNGLHRNEEAVKHAEQAVQLVHQSLPPNSPAAQRYQPHLNQLRRENQWSGHV